VDWCGPERWRRRWFAGSHILNGMGQVTGRDVIETDGFISGPIFLTGTRSLGAVYDAAIAWALSEDPATAEDLPIPVVAECDDGYLSSPEAVCGAPEVLRAHAALADGPVPEGSVGAGTGMHLFGYKGGIGTASRRVATLAELPVYTVGVLVLTNFGSEEDIRLPADVVHPPSSSAIGHAGSCIGLVMTDAPLHPQQLNHLAQRVGFGLVRTGSVGRSGSGEIFLAVSTANAMTADQPWVEARFLTPRPTGPLDVVNALYAATVDAAEEAVWNALVAATTVVGQQGRLVPGFYP